MMGSGGGGCRWRAEVAAGLRRGVKLGKEKGSRNASA
jgi:hypothetical protein